VKGREHLQAFILSSAAAGLAAFPGLTASTVICRKVAMLRSVVPESTASCSSVMEADTKASSSSNHASSIPFNATAGSALTFCRPVLFLAPRAAVPGSKL
jgi:hypothetical protein